jgi:prepilin-type N-terminal cleavage/methylation domain-containing protein
MTSASGIPKKACSPRARTGFTLVELCLVLALLAMIATLAAVSLGAWQSTRFEEHAGRCESLLTMLRADAVSRARRIELGFDEVGRVAVAWEPDPLERPGEFLPYTAALWERYVPGDEVVITRCVLAGEGVWRAALQEDLADDADPELQAVRFQRDGTSDSARIEIAPADEADPRRAVVVWNGRTATAETTILHEEQLEKFYDRLEQQERTPYERE